MMTIQNTLALDITKIQRNTKPAPPRIVIYGAPKIGKTSFAATIPNNLLLDVEGGSGFANVARVERDALRNYKDFKSVLQQVESIDHSFRTLTIDTVDWLEKIVFEEAARRGGKTNIADVPYGAGYAEAQTIWGEILNTLDRIRNARGVMILMLAHEQLRTIHDPQAGVYEKYTLKLQDKDKGSSSVSLIKEWVDAILFADLQTFISSEKIGMNQSVKRATGGERKLYTMESPAFLAGNRLQLPPELPFEWQALYNALCQSLLTQPTTEETNNG